MRIFLTGGTGFIGGHVIEQALAAGHEVTALRRPGSAPRRALMAEPHWVEGDWADDWRSVLKRQDVLMHLASHSTNPPYDHLQACLQANVVAPMALAEQAREAGISHFVVAGSCFEYGPSAPDPIPPAAPLMPNNAYATSKAAASVAFLGWAQQHSLKLQLLRVFHVYGPGELESRFWPSLRRAALSGADFPMSPGEQVRDFVSVEDVARQFLASLAFEGVRPGMPRQAHVASGQAQTLLAFAQHWWSQWRACGQLLPGRLPYRDGEVMRLVPQAAAEASRS